jgi:hypothetical protein
MTRGSVPPLPPQERPAPPRTGTSTATIVVIVVVVVIVVTVVPAVALYYLISGLSESSTNFTPIVLASEVNSTAGPLGEPPSYYVSIGLSPSAPVFTDQFALRLSNGILTQPVIGASSACLQGAGPTESDCLANGAGWYAVLVSGAGKVSATYCLSGGNPTWTNLPTGTGGVLVSDATSLLVVSSASYASADYVLEAYGTGSVPVSGYVVL